MNTSDLRPSGLPAVGALPWGTHFCQFFETNQDFVDTLLPYIHAGIAAGELCLWVYSSPYDQVTAEQTLAPQPQLRLIPYAEFFLNHDRFDQGQAHRRWQQVAADALAAGYQGLRAIGHHTRVEQAVLDYEASLDAEMAGHKVIALCAYSLAGSSALQLLDVASVHERAVSLRRGVAQVLEPISVVNKKAELTRELTEANEELRRLGARLESVRDEESTRIARELHDELGSTLTGLKWELEETEKSAPQRLRGRFQAMHGLLDRTLASVRRIAGELRPSILNDLGLVAAIRWQAQQFQHHSGIECCYGGLKDPPPLSRDTGTALFRILQEALTNVLRHAAASRVDITLTASSGHLQLQVRDNGRGMSIPTPGGLGLVGMRERAVLVGGKLTIAVEPGRGTVVTVSIPHP